MKILRNQQGFRKDNTVIILFVLVLVFGMFAIAQALYILTRPDLEEGLHFPIQEILNEGPKPVIISLEDSEIQIQGTKCNLTSDEIQVTGTAYFRPLAPGGKSILYSEGVATRTPGCVTTHYINEVIPEVVEATCELIAEGYRNITWELNGTETPIDASILPETWHTEPFILEDTTGICT